MEQQPIEPFLDPNVISTSGNFLEKKDAEKYLQAFFEAESPSVLVGKEKLRETIVSGQVIGIELLKDFVSRIETYNNTRGTDLEIIGVRVYPSLSERKTLPGKILKDIIFEPILSDGTDFHKLEVLENKHPNVKMIGEALPCPNLCITAFDFHC